VAAVYTIGGRLAALADLGLLKTAQAALPGEFAPGIPKGKPVSPLPTINADTLNRWTLAVQHHETARSGGRAHFDLRLVDPDAGKAHSWAIPKARLPEPGERLLAVQTFTHTPDYALHFGEKGEQTIGSGYGAGKVRMALKEPVDVVEANRDKVRFNVYQGKDINEYVLHRTHGDKWLLQNVTITKEKRPDIPQSKPDYKETTPDKVDVTNDQQLMAAKVDGAHNTFVLDAGHPVRVFSYRPTERDTGVIEHSHRFLPGYTTRVPDHLDQLVLRGELVAADPHTGRARGTQDTGAVLNSGVWKSRDLQTHTPLRAIIFDVARRHGKDLESLPYEKKLSILGEVHKSLPFLELPPMARTPKEKIDLLNRIRTGQEPITSEGVVLWPLAGGPPTKAKFRPDHDVYVREVYPETGARTELAGGFRYSWTPEGKIVGNVGTGLDHALKRDMLSNPAKYIGRVAKVQALGLYHDKEHPKKPGALRAPAFKDWHLDKNLGLLPSEEKTSQHIRDATAEDLARFHIRDIDLRTSEFGTPHQVKLDVTPEGKFRGLVAAEPGTGRLTGLYVSPPHRRQGVATQLLKSLPTPATSLQRISKNRGAKRFYESLGFHDAALLNDPRVGKVSVMERKQPTRKEQ